MADAALTNLLASIAGSDIDAVLVLSDFLEERGDPRAPELRRLYRRLRDDWMYAPYAFQHFRVTEKAVRAFFPESAEGEQPA